MSQYSHSFVEAYQGPVAFGLSREVDEASLIVYLLKFSYVLGDGSPQGTASPTRRLERFMTGSQTF